MVSSWPVNAANESTSQDRLVQKRENSETNKITKQAESSYTLVGLWRDARLTKSPTGNER